MTPSSDLDLIVIYDHDAGAHKSDGKKSLAPGEYYSRLTKRLINSLTAPTAEGNLFEVDMRLRPSGTAGPLASHIDAFAKYHDESSWAWEHMALAKARAISGDDEFIHQVNQIIEKTLTRSREPTQLLADVAGMRERIDKEHGTDSILEIKYFRGGIVDIEFIVQYLQLRHAADHPSILCTNTADRSREPRSAQIIGRQRCRTAPTSPLDLPEYSRSFATYPGRTAGRTQLTHASEAASKKPRGSMRIQHNGGPRGVFGNTCEHVFSLYSKKYLATPQQAKTILGSH